MGINIVGVNGQIGSGKDTVADRFVEKGYVKVSLADPMKRFAQEVFGFTEEQLWGPSDNRNAVDTRFHKGSAAWASAYNQLQSMYPWIVDLVGHDRAYGGCKSLINWFNELQADHPNLSPRICLQTLGTEWGRSVHKNVWIDYLARVATELSEEGVGYMRMLGVVDYKAGQGPTYRGVVVPDIRFENELLYCKDNGYSVIKVVRPDTDDQATQTGVPQHTSETEQQGFDEDLFSVIIQNNGSLEDLLAAADAHADMYR